MTCDNVRGWKSGGLIAIAVLEAFGGGGTGCSMGDWRPDGATTLGIKPAGNTCDSRHGGCEHGGFGGGGGCSGLVVDRGS